MTPEESGPRLVEADAPEGESTACTAIVPSGIRSMGEWAIAYAQAGWNVFPLHTPEGSGCSRGNPECGNHAGKHPRIEEWPEVSSDPAAVEEWWRQ
jgi:hypothetical protein